MPGVERLAIFQAVEAVGEAIALGIPVVALFPATPTEKKTPECDEAVNAENLICRAVRAVKAAHGDRIGVICDVALDPYSSHGQDGLVRDGYRCQRRDGRPTLPTGGRAGRGRLRYHCPL